MFKAKLGTPGRIQRHGTDCAVVGAKNTFGRSQNGVLDKGEKST